MKLFNSLPVIPWEQRMDKSFGDGPTIHAMLGEIADLRNAKHSLEVSLSESRDDFNEITSTLAKQSLVWDDENFMYIHKPL